MKPGNISTFLMAASLLVACGNESGEKAAITPAIYDLIIENGTLYDGLGGPARPRVDIAIKEGRIAAIGDLDPALATSQVSAEGLAVAPGFINMLSWGVTDLLHDGRGLSDIYQGVTLEVFGEGVSMGPLTPEMVPEMERIMSSDYEVKIEWSTLGEYLDYMVDKGVSPNVASFLGATTLRMNQMGGANRAPTDEELETMKRLVREGMEEGALGIGSSLIYAPAFYASTEELIALVGAAAPYGGSYISHLRNEGNNLMEAVEELISISEATGAGAEIYHLKAAGEANWPKMRQVFARIEAARAAGLDIRADMYTYTAGATGLDAAMPPWVQEGSLEDWVNRLKDPDIRARVIEEMKTPTDAWDNLYLAAGSPDRLLFGGFRNPDLKPLTGKTLAEVMALRGTGPEETMIDLVIEDGSRVGTAYFIMDEENIKAKIRQPWVSFGSDGGAMAPEGAFLGSNPHPRAYGNFARLIGHYVRDEAVIPLEEAIRRLTSLPAENLKIRERGRIAAGFKADIVVFDPASVRDRATFAAPHQLAEGMVHVFVNGVQVLKDGNHTGALPGEVVRGPGWSGWAQQAKVAD